MVDDLGMIQGFRCDLFHFLIGQCEVEEILVLCHSFRLCALGQNDYTSLHIPSQDNLGRALAVLRTDRCQFRICEDAMLAFGQRRPRLRLDAEFPFSTRFIRTFGKKLETPIAFSFPSLYASSIAR